MEVASAHPEPTISTLLRSGLERRRAERRSYPRARNDRRLADRRGALARAGLVAALVGLFAHARLPVPTSLRSEGPARNVTLPAPSPTPPAGPYERFIEEAAALHGVSAALVRAVIKTESNFNARAISRAGARGLMQLTPVTLRELGLSIDPFDPRENILAGAKYLSRLLDRHQGDVALALASYNAGPTAVKRHRGIPPFKETRGYVRKIQNLLAETRAGVIGTEPIAAD